MSKKEIFCFHGPVNSLCDLDQTSKGIIMLPHDKPWSHIEKMIDAIFWEVISFVAGDISGFAVSMDQ